MDWLWVSLLALGAMAGANTLPVNDADFVCIDRARAESYIQDLHIDVESFGGLELCDAKADSKKLFNDLRLIEEGQFNGSASNVFIRDFVPADLYYSWFKEETRSIARGQDVPYATAYNSGGHFTMQDGWAKLSTLGRVGTVIHEARHTEGYVHEPCDHGPYEENGLSVCDQNVGEGGSHAVEMEYYARVVLQGANFHPAYQAMARLMLLGRSNFVFNENPLSANDALLAREKNQFIRFKGEHHKTLSWNFEHDENARLKRTSLGTTLLDLPNAWALDLSGGESVSALGDEFSYFKLLKLNPPADLADLEEFDRGRQRYLFALDEQGRLYSYNFGRGAWRSGPTMDHAERFVTVDPSGAEGIYMIFSDESYCALSTATLNCESARLAWPTGARSFTRFNGELLKLNRDGKVLDESDLPWPDLKDALVLDLVQIPQYDVFH